jgi:hypothetical protein
MFQYEKKVARVANDDGVQMFTAIGSVLPRCYYANFTRVDFP